MVPLLDRRLVFVTGKGGVGKTSVAAALGLLAAEQGKRTLVAEVDAKGNLADFFEVPGTGYEPREIAPNLLAMTNANVAGASGVGVSAAPIHHGSSTTIDADASAAANADANPAPTAGQPMLATLDVAPLSARPLWQRIAAIATTALVLVVAWVLRRNKQRSVAPAGERFTDL